MKLEDQKNYRMKRNEDGDISIQGKRGVITQYPDSDLDIWITNKRAAIKAEAIWKAKNHYDDGALFIRPYADLALAARFIKAPKRRQVTEAMRQKGAELAARMRSLKEKTRQGSISQEQNEKTHD